MGRNEIRLRRQISSGRIAQHRNYGELMARHEKEQRLKRILRIFIYFLIIAFMLSLFFLINRIIEKQDEKQFPPSPSTAIIEVSTHIASPLYLLSYSALNLLL